ncbi:AGR358Wp [Eremothecium gossypii ATCC 10895]|uniref:Glutamine-dependent NAD(+) synthetase n=1 Tax=Eremothecium gossypii (strain ATCC 10895 / CBS 109.51 / FGSC 9923 / NRRL Y-1056) TaxID=284811 RepID=Q74Z48_EREGS|nr:AGR358Wp [Eremothecium gossypii ATCC 10895]AAS54848.1 AGR358Wp [Eremothecium gossypii ATCC 10895]AEY99180.1 FAGR358Wp [Eremothecium gossypii FDAG1]
MSHLITLATCNLNQWALDFEGNRDRILESIRIAKEKNAKLRVGPELEVSGYGCLDHFLEDDVYLHSWEMYAQILKDEKTHGILLDIGMPVVHKNVRYNCRVLSLDGHILFIRPKLWLANDGNYREMRFFTPWMKPTVVEEFQLPPVIQKITGQHIIPFGDAVIRTLDTCIGAETCEELFTPQSPNIAMSLDGVEIITNSSGSHHELRKLHKRLDLILGATGRCGGVYLYANQRGCDGDRLYYDGCALIAVNGRVVAQGSQFSLRDVEVVTATVDLQEVRDYRMSVMSRGLQAVSNNVTFERIQVPVELAAMQDRFNPTINLTKAKAPYYHSPEEEIALGPACWLWDYLRRCRGTGYFLPLSGGIDSCATAVIVHSMCRMVVKEASEGNLQVIADARRLARASDDWIPTDAREFANMIFHTCFMGTANSTNETRSRAKKLAEHLGAYHVDLNMDSVVKSVVTLFEVTTGKRPIFKVFGGSNIENLALQNIQARLRMVLAYLFAQLLPWVRSIKNSGGLLVLGSANVDECLRGYLTKYDCSSADINPIGGISKKDLKNFISYASKEFDLPILREFVEATPTAELEPITEDYVQSDERDMGMTYEELSVFGYLRKVEKCGPYSMFLKLLHEWTPRLTPSEVAEKVKRFFYFYAINRHKQTVLTPSYHAEQYSPDDNRFDLRPFLIDPRFSWASKKIDLVVKQCEGGPSTTQLDVMSVD